MLRKDLNLESLHVSRHWDTDKLKGVIKFRGADGKVEVNLSEKHMNTILDVVADSIVAAAQEIATELTKSVIDQTTALPVPE